MEPSPEMMRVLRFGPFEANFTAGELRKHGIHLKLQDQPFQVLKLLLARPGELITREEIRQSLWPSGTFVDFDNGLNAAVNRLREALGDSAERPKFIETLPRRGYRFIGTLDGVDPQRLQVGGPRMVNEAEVSPAVSKRWKLLVPAAVIVVAAAVAGTFYFRSRQSAIRLTDKDTIVLADFTNTTGDAVFDGTLRQGLSVQLEQSPFLSTISDQQIQQTLAMMDLKPDAKLTPQIARELCQRTASAAVLDGSIASLGNQYVLGLKAVDCRTGDFLAQEQATADSKEQVLRALSEAAVKLRRKLGESTSTVQKYDTPLEQATTSSLEALQAFSLGWKSLVRNRDDAAAIPLFQRAIKLDTNFAVAYWALGMSYGNLGENSLASEHMRKAFELRQHVSERERLSIEANYPLLVTGNFEKAQQALEVWAQTYPRDWGPQLELGNTYRMFGQFDKATAKFLEALRLSPDTNLIYGNIVSNYRAQNRLEEARAAAREALEKKLDSNDLHVELYVLAFVQNDAEGMSQQVAWGMGKPGIEDQLPGLEANTAAYSGQLAKARIFSRRAIITAKRAELKEAAAGYEADAALREALFGNAAEARQRAASALVVSTGRDVQYVAALSLALAGDAARAAALAGDLDKRFPEDTAVQLYYLPTVKAQLALDHDDSSKAIELLEPVAPYELAQLNAVYVRGNAYVAAHKGDKAAAEFQKILDQRGNVGNDPIGTLAHLGLARAYAMQGDTAKAKAAYQDFLTLWKDADPDIPIFLAAKSEYTKLK